MKIINQERPISKEDLDKVNSHYSNLELGDKKIYGALDKMALKVAIDFLKEKGYTIISEDFLKNKKNILKIKNKKSNKEVGVKVLVSGLSLPGKTRKAGSTSKLMPVISQRSYLVDKGDSYSDQYMFLDRNFKFENKKNKISFNIFSIIPGDLIKYMLFQPLRERFIDKKFCILKKESYNKGKGDPFSIMEILEKKNKE